MLVCYANYHLCCFSCCFLGSATALLRRGFSLLYASHINRTLTFTHHIKLNTHTHINKNFTHTQAPLRAKLFQPELGDNDDVDVGVGGSGSGNGGSGGGGGISLHAKTARLIARICAWRDGAAVTSKRIEAAHTGDDDHDDDDGGDGGGGRGGGGGLACVVDVAGCGGGGDAERLLDDATAKRRSWKRAEKRKKKEERKKKKEENQKEDGKKKNKKAKKKTKTLGDDVDESDLTTRAFVTNLQRRSAAVTKSLLTLADNGGAEVRYATVAMCRFSFCFFVVCCVSI
jgi:hypothetical protein